MHAVMNVGLLGSPLRLQPALGSVMASPKIHLQSRSRYLYGGSRCFYWAQASRHPVILVHNGRVGYVASAPSAGVLSSRRAGFVPRNVGRKALLYSTKSDSPQSDSLKKTGVISRLASVSLWQQSRSSASFHKIIALAKPERKRLLYAIGLLFVSSSVSLSIPFTIGKLIDFFASSDPVRIHNSIYVLQCIAYLSFAPAHSIRVESHTGVLSSAYCVYRWCCCKCRTFDLNAPRRSAHCCWIAPAHIRERAEARSRIC